VGVLQKDPDPLDNDNPLFKKGALVTSLTQKCNVKDRFVIVPKDDLIMVPGSLDPGEAVYVVSTVLPAFEALHHGGGDTTRVVGGRYSTRVLQNKRVLIATGDGGGGGSVQSQATAKMALWGGASAVFLLDRSSKVLSRCNSSTCSRTANHGEKTTVAVLGENPDDCLSVVQGDMDIVIDFDFFATDRGSVGKALAPNGRLVCVQRETIQWRHRDSYLPDCRSILTDCGKQMEISSLLAVPGAIVFDFEEHIHLNLAVVKVRKNSKKKKGELVSRTML
jgi:NADPH:quinone reductase-like Zn-dependent oxidoreductase